MNFAIGRADGLDLGRRINHLHTDPESYSAVIKQFLQFAFDFTRISAIPSLGINPPLILKSMLDPSELSINVTGSVYKRPCAGTGRRRSSTRRRRTLSLVNGKISTRNPRLENGRGFFVNLAPQPR